MTIFQPGSLQRTLSNQEPIPEAHLSYLEQRAINGFYDFVLSKYRTAKESDGLTKADLARRINKGQDQVSRWLSTPSNWTIGTVARLLVGIGNEEALLNSQSFLDRAAVNRRAADHFVDTQNIEDAPVRHSTTRTPNVAFEVTS